MVVSLILVAAIPAFTQTPVGTGHSPVAEAGPGLDLLVWNDGTSIRATRISASGAPLDLPPLTLGVASTRPAPQVAWDGQGFAVVWLDADSIRLRRVWADGLLGTDSSFGPVPNPSIADLALASNGAGSARILTAPFVLELSVENGVIQPVQGGAERDGTVADAAVEWSIDRFVYGWIGTSSRCGESGCLVLPTSTGPGIMTRSAAAGTLTSTRRGEAVFGWASLDDPAEFHLVRPWPGSVSSSVLRLPFSMRLQNGTSLFAVGGNVRVLLDDSLRLREATLFDIGPEENVETLLPHSGFVVTAAASGTGPLAVRAPSSRRFDIAVSPVFTSPESVWVKIENRGPDSPEAVHLWVRGRVRSFSSLSGGVLVDAGPISLIRFDGIFHKGAGYEVRLFFEEPIDPERFEAWIFAAGTDLDATNNRMGPPVGPGVEPEPAQSRRRAVGRNP